MKSKILMGCLIFMLLLSMPIACKGPAAEILAPSPEVLAKEGFAFPEIPRITCEELKQLIDKEDDFVLVDTRAEISFKGEHLKGAINIPGTPVPPLTEQMIKTKLSMLPGDKLIVFYCD